MLFLGHLWHHETRFLTPSDWYEASVLPLLRFRLRFVENRGPSFSAETSPLGSPTTLKTKTYKDDGEKNKPCEPPVLQPQYRAHVLAYRT